jgi:hypothetical protein
MLSKRSVLAAMALFVVATNPFAFAQQDPSAGASPKATQVQQLQVELSKMETEMNAMQKSMQTGNIPPEQFQVMQPHMTRMRAYWKQMHAGCCGINPAGYGCGGMMGRSDQATTLK